MKHTVLLLIFCLFFVAAQPVSAHLPGQPPYFKINEKYSDLYPVQSVFPDIELPQDIAPEHYLVNQPIDFAIDTEKLKEVVPEEIIKKTTFKWKLGDGSTAEGLQNTHTYTKMGSYVLEIYVSYTENGQTLPDTLIQSVLLHVLPDKKYQLPTPVILVNGEPENKDPKNNVFRMNLREAIVFDASSSKAPSSRIASYLWGFGDGTTKQGVRVKHQFANKLGFVSPGVRITDENGFFADANVGIKHDTAVATQTKKTVDKQFPVWGMIALPVVLLFAVLFIWLMKSDRGNRR